MTEWYKALHAEVKDRVKGPKTVLQECNWADMRKSIELVMVEKLGLQDVLEEGAYNEQQVTLLVITLMMLLHTHRHQKPDVYIVEAQNKL